ncbi:MAG: phospholipid/cholesterol/gamma-HCH transport system substrate-binding protein [Rickettsiales bacterium]|jgi:phospholipid/cholesterol/gamma-HCH transport system substrate-binding protein
MKNNIFEIVVGTFVLSCAVYFFFFSFNKSGISAATTYQIIAKFDNIDGVSSGSDIKISGVKVGTISEAKIDPKTYQAILTLDVDNQIKLPTDSSAKILSSGLLGGKYVGLEIGANEEILQNGDRIMFTQSGVNFEELLGKFIFGSKKEGANADK